MRRDNRNRRFGVYLYDNMRKPKFKCEHCGHTNLIIDCKRVPYIICSYCKHKIIVDKKLNFNVEVRRLMKIENNR